MERAGTVTGAAVVAVRHGGPQALAVRFWRVPPPRTQQVRLRVEAAGISFADLLMCRGLHPERRPAPFVPGWDVVGVVESVGAGVHGLRVGDRVAALCVVGGWAEHVLVPAALAVPVPDTVSSTDAVTLAMDYVAAYQMLTRSGPVAPGDTVLVQGVAGGVGTALTQLARLRGVRVLGTDRAEKRRYVESHGGVLIDVEHEDVLDRVRALTGGRGVDCAYDGIGATAGQSLRALRPRGRLVWFGMVTLLSGGVRDRVGGLRTAGNLAAALAGNLRPGGRRTTVYSVQRLARHHPDRYRRDLGTLLAMLADHEIAPHVTAVHPLEEAPAALLGLARGAAPGKQVVAITVDATMAPAARRGAATVPRAGGGH